MIGNIPSIKGPPTNTKRSPLDCTAFVLIGLLLVAFGTVSRVSSQMDAKHWLVAAETTSPQQSNREQLRQHNTDNERIRAMKNLQCAMMVSLLHRTTAEGEKHDAGT